MLGHYRSSHVHYSAAQKWFARERRSGFRTCPLTQIGLVGISSNPKFTPVSPREAIALLERITSMPEHKFWPSDLGLLDAVGRLEPIIGHRQITDAYLLGLARARRGILATLDRGVPAFAGEKRHGEELIRVF